MHKRYTYLILCLIVLTTTRSVVQGLYLVSPSSYTWPVFEVISMARSLEQDDPESALSRGEKICFWTADQSTLTLVPGIGEKLAIRLIGEQANLARLMESKSSPPATLLRQVKGIGVKTGKKLMTYLDFKKTSQCQPKNSS